MALTSKIKNTNIEPMNRLEKALSDLLTKHKLREKVLVAPTFSSGHQIAESLVKKGCPYLNLRIKTTHSLAHDIAALELASDSVSLLSETSILILIEEIFHEQRHKKGSYFAGIEVKSGIINALGRAINSLRMCGISSGDLLPKQFVSKQKGKEIIELLQKYESLLEEKKYADYPEVLHRAIKIITSNKLPMKNELYLFLSDMQLTGLEKKLVELLPCEKIILPHDVPDGLIYPDKYLTSSHDNQADKPKSDIDLMTWLFAADKAPTSFKDSSVQMFHAVGRRNEVREVMRGLISSPIKCDQTELIYTSYDDYVPLVYETAIKFGIKTTIEEGIPITFTRCGRAVLGLISWIASNYEAIKFRQLLTSGFLNVQSAAIEDIEPSPALMGRIIRESSIGWERARYFPILEQMEAMYASKILDDEESESRKELHKIKGANTKFLIEIIKNIFSFIPEADTKGMISISELCSGVIIFNNKYCRVSDELDAEAKSAINNMLDEISRLSNQKVTLHDALNRIEIVVKEIRVGQSGPDSGCIHVSSYKRGGRTGRTHTFVMGCDAQLFPGTPSQNPVLLDEEVQSISGGLSISTDLLKENLYRMAALLSSLKGSVTFSFSSFDVLEGRESFPSSLLLQVHRLMTGDITADYSGLIKALGIPSGYVPGKAPIDSTDYWLRMFTALEGLKKADAATIGLYPGLLEGINASCARESDAFTKYDGKMAALCSELDPRENQDIVISASMIEKFAKCPFSYFLRYVLRIKPLEEVIIEKGEWLDAMQRGSLLHELFYRFMTEITSKKEKPSLLKHKKLIEKLADEIIKEYRKDIPIPGEAVFEQERKKIFKTAEVFLRTEDEHCKKCDPILFEAPFGFIDKDMTASELSGPMEIDLGNKKKIKVRGRIDRIDSIGEHEYEIWDYKTGSTFGHKDHDVFSGGKVIQHALYSIAAEMILKAAGIDKTPHIMQSGYFFPTEKGRGRRFLKGQDEKTLKELLNTIFDIVGSGAFISTDKDDCKYCDYKAVCTANVLECASKKFANEQNIELTKVSRMKEYV